MDVQIADDFRQRKQAIREQAHRNRNQQPQKDELSRLICDRFVELPEYRGAECVLFYVDARSEVRTRQHLPLALGDSKRIVVPYCVEGQLELFWLRCMDELSLGAYRILEPAAEWRARAERRVAVEELDLIMVPGVAFDERGARMGHGFGYYDKLLERARAEAPLVALAFECQIFPDVPTQAHDVFMDKILTEARVIAGRGRADGR
jgi:5-formyltetrahydrofolate cyclo-ligase